MTFYYLATFRIIDGEHEHTDYFIVPVDYDGVGSVQQQVTCLEKAYERAGAEEHDTLNYNKGTYWDYGDGTTASQLKDVKKITREQAQTLHNLGVAFYL